MEGTPDGVPAGDGCEVGSATVMLNLSLPPGPPLNLATPKCFGEDLANPREGRVGVQGLPEHFNLCPETNTFVLCVRALLRSTRSAGDANKIKGKRSPNIEASRVIINVRGPEGIHVFVPRLAASNKPPLPAAVVARPKVSLARLIGMPFTLTDSS